MSKQNKDTLENFFRERAQHHDLEFNEGDWFKLEKRLDQELPVAFSLGSFLKKFWFIPVLFLLLPTSWYTYDQISKSNFKDNNNEISSELKRSTSNDFDVNKSASGKSEKANINTYDESKQLTPTKTEKYGNSNSNGNQLNSESPDFTKDDGSVLVDIRGNEQETNNIGYAVLENGAESAINRTDYQLHFLSPLAPDLTIEETITTEILEKEIIMKISPKPAKRSGLNVGIGYSPDFSTVGIGNFVAPGSRWYILLEYIFSNRFVVNTGAIWVQNKYEAYGEDYHAPSRYWKKGIVAEEAYGECTMVDIPVNIRYNFLVKGKSQAFISAGASTYFLLKEDYYFHYEQDDPELPDHWGTDKTTIYPFGIINLSMGYQYQFARRSTLQIEPFIKIPTTGVGWGKVDLHSMGVYFIYKYRIINNKR